MSSGELVRIIVPLMVVFGLAAVLVGLVRRRSAAREKVLMEFADRHALKYAPGGKDFYQGSWPGKVKGTIAGRKLTLQYRNDPKMTRQGYARADYSAVLEIAVRNPQQGSLSLQAGLKGKQPGGTLFADRVIVSSKPEAFFDSLRIDADLCQHLVDVLTKDWMNPGAINVVRTGSLTFERHGIFYRSDDLAGALDVLGRLADRIESQPGR